MKKFLILTWSTGSWHIAASNALSMRLREQWHEAHVEDICHFSRGGIFTRFVHKYISEYLGWFGSVFFYITNNFFCKRLWNRFWLFSNSHKFETIMAAFQPDYIIFTQKSRIPILTSYVRKNGKPCSINCVITHFGRSIHTLRVMDPKVCDVYFVFDKPSKEYLIERFDVPANQIIVSFLPMPQEVFCKRKVIYKHKLMMLCTGLNTSFVKQILDVYKDKPRIEISVSCARNENIVKLIPFYKKAKNIRFYSYFKNIGSSLRNYDLFIGKPGGAILWECIASETPIIAPSHFYGEEDANVDIIRDYKVGFYIKDAQDVIEKIEHYDFSKLLGNFKVLKKDACAIILNTVLEWDLQKMQKIVPEERSLLI